MLTSQNLLEQERQHSRSCSYS